MKQHKDNGLVPDNIFISKRLQIAAMMMQGLVSDGENGSLQEMVVASYAYADALIKAEDDDEQIPTEN